MSQLNPLNDLSKVYLDQVAKINQQDEANDIKRWEEGEKELQQQMETSAKELATLGAPQMEEEVSYVESYVTQLNKTLVGSPMEEEKKAAKDYDGDGKIESGKDEYFGSKDKAIKKAMGKKIKEGMSNWRYDLKEIPNYDQIPETSKDRNKKIEEKKVKNSVKINPNMEEGYGDKKKKKHDCASKVKHEEFGIGNCIKGMHTIDENNMVTHYDVEFKAVSYTHLTLPTNREV